MTLKKLASIPFMAIALLAVGCGADCEDVCEDAKECDGASQEGDCAQACEDAEKLAEDSGCEDEYDDFVSCASDDACANPLEACTSELTKLGECTGPYCMNNPDACDI